MQSFRIVPLHRTKNRWEEEQVDEIAATLWIEIEEQELTVDEACLTIRQYWMNVQQSRKALVKIRKTFQLGDTVWPDQCAMMVALLLQVTNDVQNFLQFLVKGIQLPYPICESRYALIRYMSRLHEQLQIIHSLMTTSRAKKHGYFNVQEILVVFEELFDTWRKTQYHVKALVAHGEPKKSVGSGSRKRGKILPFPITRKE